MGHKMDRFDILPLLPDNLFKLWRGQLIIEETQGEYSSIHEGRIANQKILDRKINRHHLYDSCKFIDFEEIGFHCETFKELASKQYVYYDHDDVPWPLLWKESLKICERCAWRHEIEKYLANQRYYRKRRDKQMTHCFAGLFMDNFH